MGKIIGCFFFFVGIAGILYSWVCELKIQKKRIQEVIIFLQRTIPAMENEHIKVIDYLKYYKGRDDVLDDTLKEIADKLMQYIYPDGKAVWENVIRQRRTELGFDQTIFEEICTIGDGLFGHSRKENVEMLERSLRQLEELQTLKNERDANARKVWIPIGMLGGIMFMIILI